MRRLRNCILCGKPCDGFYCRSCFCMDRGKNLSKARQRQRWYQRYKIEKDHMEIVRGGFDAD